MTQIIKLLLPLVALASHVRGAAEQNQTKLSVYYETLCGDSKRFITQQLYPFMRSPMGKYVDLELVPYGKAKTVECEEDNCYEFECQHGAKECEGNKVHACAIAKLSKTDALKFVYCSMGSSYPPGAGPECSEQNGFDYNPIENCTTKEGDQLLAANGIQTHGLKPTLYFVPWIVYDGSWNRERMERSLKDLQKEMCSYIGEAKCSQAHENRGNRRYRRRSISSFSKIHKAKTISQ